MLTNRLGCILLQFVATHMKCHFGKSENDEMILNEYGKIANNER